MVLNDSIGVDCHLVCFLSFVAHVFEGSWTRFLVRPKSTLSFLTFLSQRARHKSDVGKGESSVGH